MKKIINTIFLVLLFVIFTGGVFALSSSYHFDPDGYYENIGSPAGTPYGSYSNLQDEDGNVYGFTSQKQMRIVMNPDTSVWDLPPSATIIGFSALSKHRITTSHGASNYAFLQVAPNIVAGTVAWNGTCTSSCIADKPEEAASWDDDLAYSSSTTSFNEEENIWMNYPVGHPSHITAQDFIDGNVGLSVISTDSTARTREWDYIRWRIWYTVPEFTTTIESEELDEVNGKVNLSISGQFPIDIESDDVRCTIDIYQNHNLFTPALTVEFFPGVGSGTVCYNNGYCRGHGIDIGDSTYEAENLPLPYRPASTTTYPMSWRCVEQSCVTEEIDGVLTKTCTPTEILGSGQGLNPDSSGYDEDFILLPTSTVDADAYLQPDCETLDLVCHFQNWLSSYFDSVFGIRATNPEDNYEIIQQQLYRKAPFAYVMPVFDLQFNTEASDTVPALELDIVSDKDGIPDSFVWAPPEYIEGLLTLTRTFFQVVVWIGFVFYLLQVPRRII